MKKPEKLREVIGVENLQTIAAIALIAVGVGLFSVPIALIVVGVLLLVDRVT